jgi:hypothetical protein
MDKTSRKNMTTELTSNNRKVITYYSRLVIDILLWKWFPVSTKTLSKISPRSKFTLESIKLKHVIDE